MIVERVLCGDGEMEYVFVLEREHNGDAAFGGAIGIGVGDVGGVDVGLEVEKLCVNQTSLKVVETDDRTLEGSGNSHGTVAGIGIHLTGLVVLLFNGIIGWGFGINILNLAY